MREEFNPLIKSCATWTDPAAKTKSIGLQAYARVVMVFARHLDNFIVTWQFLPTYRDHAIWTVLSWHQTVVHLSGLCKNTCQPWRRRHLIKPPGRYAAIIFSFCVRLPACTRTGLRWQLDTLIIPRQFSNTWQIRWHMTTANGPTLLQAQFQIGTQFQSAKTNLKLRVF